jgi:predicted ATP-grasp superfamily ATP-dependent carboligase
VHYQEFLEGESRSGVFVAGSAGVHLVGVTWQLVGIDWLHAAAFRYAGSIGPLQLSASERAAWERLGVAVTAFAGLRGLFGIDAIVRDGVPWLVEVNPRYTASVEVIEYATRLSAMALHRASFPGDVRTGSMSDGISQPSRTLTPRKVLGKGIWYAPRPLTFPHDGPWEDVLCRSPAVDQPPAFADIPAVGERISTGRPVITHFAAGLTVADCEAELRDMAAELDRLIG